ncbi:hypothetical protein FS837_012624 [Tulasnella sp. UAMH 9824]|nr:hypothetical protein FS837_012624 [Tulasnella sp. UAMH 9824]
MDSFNNLQNSPGWINPTADEINYIVPSHLYGDALRYYETLDLDCQHDWDQLQDVMARRFPRTRQKEERDQGSPRTLTQTPPITASMLTGPKRTSLGEEHSCSAEAEGQKHERPKFSLFAFKEKLRALLSTPIYGPANRPPESLATVHSMFVQYTQEGNMRKAPFTFIRAQVDLNDRQSVAACKKRPLVTVPRPAYRIEQ